MPVPDFQSLMLPILQYSGTLKEETSNSNAGDYLAKQMKLSADDLKEMLPSGLQSTFTNRIAWAITYLKKASLLKSTRRGYFCITQCGKDVVAKNHSAINAKYLEQFPEFIAFKNLKGTRVSGKAKSTETQAEISTPSEDLENAWKNLRDALAQELLARLKTSTPAFFERVVVELLVAMGYGGSRADAGKAIGRSGDGGIDGIIKEDKLGLDVIYIQAKRWDSNSVGRPDVMQFAGALQGQKATKGVFITTSSYTKDAREYVSQIGSKIVLIDGDELTTLMIDSGIGVTTVSSYSVKKIDSDYFDGEA